MSLTEQGNRRLSRVERTNAMSAIGVALGAISMLPDNRVTEKQRAKKEAKQQAIISKRKRQTKVREGLLKEQQRTKKEQVAVISTIKDLNSRLSVFDQMLRDRPKSPSTELGSFGSVSTPESTDEEDSEIEVERGVERREMVPAHSPQRFRHLYEETKTPTLEEYERAQKDQRHDDGPLEPKRGNVYHMRIDFFEQEEVARLQSYHGFSQHDYGKRPIFLELLVPGRSSPYELINAILQAWEWENSHVYRFSSNTGVGMTREPLPDQQRHYEAEAFTKNKSIPRLDAFCLKQFSPVLVEYDINPEGNHWKWHGMISEVETSSKLDHIVIREKGGHQPCQYAYQLVERYISPLEGSSEHERKKNAGDVIIEPHRMHDEKGKYHRSTKDKLNHILLGRYKDKDVFGIKEGSHYHRQRSGIAKLNVGGEAERLRHIHDARMKARGSGLSSGLAY